MSDNNQDFQDQLIEKKLTTKEELFCQEYIKDFNGTQAAIRAKYSEKTARSIASENLTKPYIRQRIKELLDECGMTREAVIKMISDISTSNMTDYFKIVKVERWQKIKQPLQKLIDELRATINFEDEYITKIKPTEKEFAQHEKEQLHRRRQIIRYKMELEQDPNSYRIVNSKSELVDDIELDLVALAKDKERGKITSFKYGKFGIEVDLAKADTQLVNMARIHGLFVDRIQQEIVNAPLMNIDPLADYEGNDSTEENI